MLNFSQTIKLFTLRSAVVFLALWSGPSASAQTATEAQIEITPANPTVKDTISIRVFGTWPNSCIPRDPRASTQGKTITVETSNPADICLQVLTPWSLTATVGPLAAGSYDVIVMFSGPQPPPREIARKTFAVTGQESTQELILPAVVNGAVGKSTHYQSTFTVLNLSAGNVKINLQVYDNAGKPGGVFCHPIAPPPTNLVADLNSNGELHRSTSADLPLLVGWARLTWEGTALVQGSTEVTYVNAPAQPCLLICNRPSTEILASAQVPAVKPAKEFRAAATITSRRHTALAVVNPSLTATATVIFALLNSSGEIFRSREMKIPPLAQVSKFVWDLVTCQECDSLPQPPPDMFHGSVKISSDITVAVGALNALWPEGKIVNVPVSAVP